MTELIYGGGAGSASPDDPTALQRYASWFHELDAWTEYWDIYHPETSGHFYFGNELMRPGFSRVSLRETGVLRPSSLGRKWPFAKIRPTIQPADFAWRGHRRTRSEYQANTQTAASLRQRGLDWASNYEAAASEIHALFRIREWGHEA